MVLGFRLGFVLFVAASILQGAALAQDDFDPFGPARPPDRQRDEARLQAQIQKMHRENAAKEMAQSIRENAAHERKTLLSLDDLLRVPIAGDFDGIELEDALQVVSKATQIPVVLDPQVVQELKIDAHREISVDLGAESMPVGQFLSAALKKAHPGLVAVVKDEIILVTTEGRSRVTTVYNLREILDRAGARESQQEKLAVRSRADLAAALRERVTGVAPESWKEKGGRGTATLFRDTLTVDQTARVHEQIRDLLRAVRTSQGAADPIADEPAQVFDFSAEARTFIRRWDRNADGLVALDECAEPLRPNFAKFDVDGDGFWSQKEAAKALRAHKAP